MTTAPPQVDVVNEVRSDDNDAGTDLSSVNGEKDCASR